MGHGERLGGQMGSGLYLKLRKLYRSESFLLEIEFCFVVDPSASLLATACCCLFPNGIMLRLEFD